MKIKVQSNNKKFKSIGIGYTDTPEFTCLNKAHKVKIIIYDSPEFGLRCRIGHKSSNIELSKIFLLLKPNQFEYLIVYLKSIRKLHLDLKYPNDERIYINSDEIAIKHCLEKYPKEYIGDYIEVILLVDNLRCLPLTIERIKIIKKRFKQYLKK